jgi:Leucine-rich repeat (LRR) protein
LNYHDIIDLTPIEEFTQLEELYLSVTKIENLSPIENLINLKVLDLSYNDLFSYQDFKIFKKLTKLESLNIFDCSFKSFEGIIALSALKKINADFNYISEISPLESLEKLRYISLVGNHQLTDISPLAKSYSLETVFFLLNSIRRDIEHCPYGDNISSPIDSFCRSYCGQTTTVSFLGHTNHSFL